MPGVCRCCFVAVSGSRAGLDCENAMAQLDMNICAHEDFEAADAELNAVWKEARNGSARSSTPSYAG